MTALNGPFLGHKSLNCDSDERQLSLDSKKGLVRSKMVSTGALTVCMRLRCTQPARVGAKDVLFEGLGVEAHVLDEIDANTPCMTVGHVVKINRGR